jgi:hypothetical protein
MTGVGGTGLRVTDNAGEVVPDPQSLVPVTVMVPEAADAEKSTKMSFVLEPELMAAPEGNVQEYPVAPVIAGIENSMPVDPWQMEVGPVMAGASPGKEFTITAKAGEVAPFPQILFPQTVIFPETAFAA